MKVASAKSASLNIYDSHLGSFAGLVKRYFPVDADVCSVKQQALGELLATILIARLGPVEFRDRQFGQLCWFKNRGRFPRQVFKLFHRIRITGNVAVRDFANEPRTAFTVPKKARAVAVWSTKR